MESDNQNQPNKNGSLDANESLETLETSDANQTISTSQSADNNASNQTPALDPSSRPAGGGPRRESPLKRLLSHSNVYLLTFFGLLVIAAVIVTVAILIGRHSGVKTVQTQAVTKQTLQQLADSDVSVGQPKQVLNVQSNAVFAGQVLVRSDLDVAGKLQVGDGLTLPDLTVSGATLLATTQVQKNLSVGGDTALQGQLSVQKGLNVAGGATVNGALSAGQLNISNLQLGGDLALSHHIVTNGATPGRSGGSALGSGGSASVSGSDTAGTVNVNTGGNAAAGCFVNITFTQKYASTPHVLVTPIGSAAASSGYYISRSNAGFSVCANTPPSGASFAFDYFVAG